VIQDSLRPRPTPQANSKQANRIALLLQQQKIAIAAAERFWAKATIYFVLSTYPGLKSGAIV
jgi:hypothetical protein